MKTIGIISAGMSVFFIVVGAVADTGAYRAPSEGILDRADAIAKAAGLQVSHRDPTQTVVPIPATAAAVSAKRQMVSQAATPYRTFCAIDGKNAVGYITVDGSMSFSGKVYFYFYDKSGAVMDKTWTIAVVVAVGTSKVAEVSAPSQARFCSVDVSEAVGDGAASQ